MKTPSLQIGKLKRALKVYGLPYSFQRPELDKYKQETGEYIDAVLLKEGIFHEQQSGNLNIILSDGANVKRKPQPYILTNFEDAKGILQNDIVFIGNGRSNDEKSKYKVTAVRDLNNYGIFAQITLEMFGGESNVI